MPAFLNLGFIIAASKLGERELILFLTEGLLKGSWNG
jgi:hypothetical protein